MNNEYLKSLIANTNGLFFNVVFKKKDNSLRNMTCRLNVTKHLSLPKGQGSNNQEHKDNLVTVFDVHANGYRSINLDTLVSFKCGDIVWKAD